MKVASLFSGIGGFEIGLAKAGHETEFMCEISNPARAVLRAHFPETELHDDIRTLEGIPGDSDILTAGFPCQDLSQAGRTRGLRGEQSRLIFEVFRLIELSRPPWVIIENVPFMLKLAKGAAMRIIVDRLEDLGYLWAWRVVDTYGFGLPQRRERVFIVASRMADPAEVLFADNAEVQRRETDLSKRAHGFYWTEGTRGLGWAADAVPALKNGSTVGIPSPPAMVMTNSRIHTPDIRDAERLQGFRSGWTKPAVPHAGERYRWSLVGSAVTTRVATWIGCRLLQPAAYDRSNDARFEIDEPLPPAARFDGRYRYKVEATKDPIRKRIPPLESFLSHEGNPLSERATAGFLKRASASRLRIPNGFLECVRAHLINVSA